MLKKYEDIPLIEDVKYLRARDLLISFDNGEQRICDMTECFVIPPTKPYYPLSEFKKFKFNKECVWWSKNEIEDRDTYHIGRDSLYNMSIPIAEFTSSLLLSIGVLERKTENTPLYTKEDLE